MRFACTVYTFGLDKLITMKKQIQKALIITLGTLLLCSCNKGTITQNQEEDLETITDPFLLKLINKKWQLNRYQVDSLVNFGSSGEQTSNIIDTFFNYGLETYTLFSSEDCILWSSYIGEEYYSYGSQDTPISYATGFYNVVQDTLGNKGLWLNNDQVYWVEKLTEDTLIFKNTEFDTQHKFWRYTFVRIE